MVSLRTAPAVLVLEGEYTSYTQQWVVNNPVEYPESIRCLFINIESNKIFVSDRNNYWFILSMTDGSLVGDPVEDGTDAAPRFNAILNLSAHSIHDKYVVVSNYYKRGIHILKDMALLQSVDIVPSPRTLSWIAMTSNGQYIAVGESSSPYTIRLYKGT